MTASSNALRKPRAFTPKRGRPSPDQVIAIEKSILTVAQELFLSDGYATTTMEAVASAAGVSKGTLYNRYPDKPTLFNAIVSDRLAAWKQIEHTRKPDRDHSLAEELQYSGAGFLESMRIAEIAAFDHLLAAESRRFPELARVFYEQGYQTAVTLLASNITRIAAASGWPVGDALSIADAFYAGLIGWIRAKRVHGEPTSEECGAYVSKLVAIFIGGRASW